MSDITLREDDNAQESVAEPVLFGATREQPPVIDGVLMAKNKVDMSVLVMDNFQKVIDFVEAMDKDFPKPLGDVRSKAENDWHSWKDHTVKDLKWRIERGHE